MSSGAASVASRSGWRSCSAAGGPDTATRAGGRSRPGSGDPLLGACSAVGPLLCGEGSRRPAAGSMIARRISPVGARMSDVEELCAAFGAGTLLHPGDGVASFVDLARAMASVCGAEGAELSPAGQELAGALGAREHLVLVLADGLGLAMIEDAEPEARFLRAHLAMELRAVFPASTAVALTTLATGEWPAQHAVTGWWTHLDEIGEAATILQFRRRSDERPLGELGVTAEAAFPVPSLLPRMQRETLCLMPRAIAGSVYSRYLERRHADRAVHVAGRWPLAGDRGGAQRSGAELHVPLRAARRPRRPRPRSREPRRAGRAAGPRPADGGADRRTGRRHGGGADRRPRPPGGEPRAAAADPPRERHPGAARVQPGR